MDTWTLAVVAGLVLMLVFFARITVGEALLLAVVLAPGGERLESSRRRSATAPSQGSPAEPSTALLRADVRAEECHVIDVTGHTLSAVTFLVFGALVLGPALGGSSWRALLYAIRMLPVALSLVRTGFRPQSV